MITLIAAMDQGRAIGRNGKIPWYLSDDLTLFKNLTAGSDVLMGRLTAESIGRALPGRRNLVVSRSTGFNWKRFPGMEVSASIEAALQTRGPNDLFVIGGETIYRQMLPHADRIFLTSVHWRAFHTDAFFPKFNHDEWHRTWTIHHEEKFGVNDYDFSVSCYLRRKG